jgi:hypothetical protein
VLEVLRIFQGLQEFMVVLGAERFNLQVGVVDLYVIESQLLLKALFGD